MLKRKLAKKVVNTKKNKKCKEYTNYLLPELNQIVEEYLTENDKLFMLGKMYKSNICPYAAGNNDLNLLKWARKNNCRWGEITCLAAAFGGHLDVLKWARQNGCPWDKNTCSKAASGGHLEVLKWARKNGCPWDESTCSNAARNGHLKVLQWLRKNGCPWDEWTCSIFYKLKRARVVNFA